MARDILGIPMSTVALDSVFSASRRVIKPHRSCLKPKLVEMLLCDADWVCELYELNKSNKVYTYIIYLLLASKYYFIL